MLRRPPAELFGDFEADGFGAFCIKRPQVDVYKSPAIFEGDLCTQAVHLIVGPAHADHVGSIDAGAQDLGSFQIRRDEDVAFQAGGRGVSRNAVSQVSCGGTANGFEAKFSCLAQRDGHHAILER